MNYEEKNKIYETAQRVVTSDLEWQDKYDMIFSDGISSMFSLDYYDPDTSYEEDVMAFMNALDEHMKKQHIISKQIER